MSGTCTPWGRMEVNYRLRQELMKRGYEIYSRLFNGLWNCRLERMGATPQHDIGGFEFIHLALAQEGISY